MLEFLEREREVLSFNDFQRLLFEMYKREDIDIDTYIFFSEDL